MDQATEQYIAELVAAAPEPSDAQIKFFASAFRDADARSQGDRAA